MNLAAAPIIGAKGSCTVFPPRGEPSCMTVHEEWPVGPAQGSNTASHGNQHRNFQQLPRGMLHRQGRPAITQHQEARIKNALGTYARLVPVNQRHLSTQE